MLYSKENLGTRFLSLTFQIMIIDILTISSKQVLTHKRGLLLGQLPVIFGHNYQVSIFYFVVI